MVFSPEQITIDDSRLLEVPPDLSPVVSAIDPMIQVDFVRGLLDDIDVVERDDEVLVSLSSLRTFLPDNEMVGMLGAKAMVSRMLGLTFEGQANFLHDDRNFVILRELNEFLDSKNICSVVADPETVFILLRKFLEDLSDAALATQSKEDSLLSLAENYSNPPEEDEICSAKVLKFRVLDPKKRKKALRGAILSLLKDQNGKIDIRVSNKGLDKMALEFVAHDDKDGRMLRNIGGFRPYGLEIKDSERAIAKAFNIDPARVIENGSSEIICDSEEVYQGEIRSLKPLKKMGFLGKRKVVIDEVEYFIVKKDGNVLLYPCISELSREVFDRPVPKVMEEFKRLGLFSHYPPRGEDIVSEPFLKCVFEIAAKIRNLLDGTVLQSAEEIDFLVSTSVDMGRFTHRVRLADPLLDEEGNPLPGSSLRGLMQLLFGIDVRPLEEVLNDQVSARKVYRFIVETYPNFANTMPHGLCAEVDDFKIFTANKEKLLEKGIVFDDNEVLKLRDLVNGEAVNLVEYFDLLKKLIKSSAEIAGDGHKIVFNSDAVSSCDELTKMVIFGLMDECGELEFECPLQGYKSAKPIEGVRRRADYKMQSGFNNAAVKVVSLRKPANYDGSMEELPFSSLLWALAESNFGIDMSTVDEARSHPAGEAVIRFYSREWADMEERVFSKLAYVVPEDFTDDCELSDQDIRKFCDLLNGRDKDILGSYDFLRKILDSLGETVLVCDISAVDLNTLRFLQDYSGDSGKKVKIVMVVPPSIEMVASGGEVDLFENRLEELALGDEIDFDGLKSWACEVGKLSDYRASADLLGIAVERLFDDVGCFADWVFDISSSRFDGDVFEVDDKGRMLMSLFSGIIEQAHRALGGKDHEASIFSGDVIQSAFSYLKQATDPYDGVPEGDELAQFLKNYACDMLMISSLYFQVKERGYESAEEMVDAMKEPTQSVARIFGSEVPGCELIEKSPAVLYLDALVCWELREYEKVIAIAKEVVDDGSFERPYFEWWKSKLSFESVEMGSASVPDFSRVNVSEKDRGIEARLSYLAAVSAAKLALKPGNDRFRDDFDNYSSLFQKFVDKGEQMIPSWNLTHFYFVWAEFLLHSGDFFGCREYCRKVRAVMNTDASYYETMSKRIEHFYSEVNLGEGMKYFSAMKESDDLSNLEKVKQKFLFAALTEKVIAEEETDEITYKSEFKMTYVQALSFLLALEDFGEGREEFDMGSVSVDFRGKSYCYSDVVPDGIDLSLMVLSANQKSIDVAWDMFVSKPNQIVDYAKTMSGFFAGFSKGFKDADLQSVLLECSKQWADFTSQAENPKETT